jgi:hypothetical protein
MEPVYTISRKIYPLREERCVIFLTTLEFNRCKQPQKSYMHQTNSFPLLPVCSRRPPCLPAAPREPESLPPGVSHPGLQSGRRRGQTTGPEHEASMDPWLETRARGPLAAPGPLLPPGGWLPALLWFLLSTLLVFLVSLAAGLLLVRWCEAARRPAGPRPPSYRAVLSREAGGLPSYSQACRLQRGLLPRQAHCVAPCHVLTIENTENTN